ncbi:MAG: hypothetical protein K2X66_18115 [Cyanobacteria bacterium]|nr:hypothetical protein [Cyanobacteriota bacterium]
MKLPAVTFGTIYRLTSKDGEPTQRYQQARRALVDTYIEQINRDSKDTKPDLMSGSVGAMDRFLNQIQTQVGSFQPTSDKFAYLAVNTKREPDPVAAEFLRKSQEIYKASQKKFFSPNQAENLTQQKNWYVTQINQLAETYKQYAVEKEI